MSARRRLVILTTSGLTAFGAFGLGSLAFDPTTASAQSPATCAALNQDPAYGLAGNPTVIAHSTTLVTEIAGRGGQPPTPLPVPFCQVDFVVSERGGQESGYAPGEIQRVGLRVGLPFNTADGGVGGGPDGEGAWNGRVRNVGGGSLVGAVGPVLLQTQARSVGSSTDSGHTGGPLDATFGVIQETGELNTGKIEDFYSESLRLQYQWALRLADTYYGKPAVRNYWEGCSTGGRQGLVLAAKYGSDFDGFLIGAPFAHQSRTSSAIGWRVWLNLEMTGTTVTPAKSAAAIARMIAECDDQDGLVDGMLSNPGKCRASAALNICGAPGAPGEGTCLTEAEARAIDMAVEGPRNDLGHRVWLSPGRGAQFFMSPVGNSGTGPFGIWGWANKDMTFDYRIRPLTEWDDLHQLTTTTVGPLLDVPVDLDLTKNRSGKILMWHGLADPDMPWPQNAYYYNQVIDRYDGLDNVTPWFRFFLAPGVGHCGGGVGPQPQNLFDTMVNWVENDEVPDSILSANILTTPQRTRPLCPFPQRAIYDGEGDPNAASSFSCGGNINTKQDKCDLLVVKYQQETGSRFEPLGGEDDISCGLASVPVTRARLSPRPVNGWHVSPTITLSARDRDSDIARSEFRLDRAEGWTSYSGPFQVVEDGTHVLQYRSVDKADHIEPSHWLRFKVDGTAPVISGMPSESCTVWPPNNQLVQVAAVKTADATSGVAPGSLSIHVTSNERLGPQDVVVKGGRVLVRATRSTRGTGRVYTIASRVWDLAGNKAAASATCTVPRHPPE